MDIDPTLDELVGLKPHAFIHPLSFEDGVIIVLGEYSDQSFVSK